MYGPHTILPKEFISGTNNPPVPIAIIDKLGGALYFVPAALTKTSTIFPPKLEAVWDDHSWNTGSLAPLTGSALDDTVVYFKGLRPEYKQNSKVRFRLVGRERYPKKTYSTTAAEVAVKHLPSGSSHIEHGTYYSIKDAVTEDVIIPFGWKSA